MIIATRLENMSKVKSKTVTAEMRQGRGNRLGSTIFCFLSLLFTLTCDGQTFFIYTNPPPVPYVTGVTLGTPANYYDGWVGIQVLVGARPLTVTQLGRMMTTGNSGTHTMKLVLTSDGTDVANGSVAVPMSGGTGGNFKYASLPSPVTLAANTAYLVLSQETAGGDYWYDWDTTVTTTSDAADNAVAWGTGIGPWNVAGVINHDYVPVSFKYTFTNFTNLTSVTFSGAGNFYGTTNPVAGLVGWWKFDSPTTEYEFVTNASLGTLRNNSTMFVGVKIVVGASDITISQLGRIMVSGNNLTHTVKIVNAATGNDIAGGSVSISMAGGISGQFKYVALSIPVVLTSGSTNYIVSSEIAGGDQWYDTDTSISTMTVASAIKSVYGWGPGQWNDINIVGASYVPVNFKYIVPNTIAIDSSGYGNTGTLSAASWTNGIVGNAWLGTGANHISVANSTSISPTNAISFSMWVFTTNINQSYGMLLSKGNGSNGFEINVSAATGMVNFTIYLNGGNWGINTGTAMPNNQWFLLSYTYSGSAIRVYTNGVLASSNLTATGVIGNPNTILYIGSRTASYQWDGRLDDVRLYSRALNQTEIQQLFNNGRPML